MPADTAKDVGVCRFVEVSSINNDDRSYGWGMTEARGMGHGKMRDPLSVRGEDGGCARSAAGLRQGWGLSSQRPKACGQLREPTPHVEGHRLKRQRMKLTGKPGTVTSELGRDGRVGSTGACSAWARVSWGSRLEALTQAAGVLQTVAVGADGLKGRGYSAEDRTTLRW